MYRSESKVMSSTKRRYEQRPGRDTSAGEVRKKRACLMCGTKFMSAWSGERICQRCRSRAAWREGHNWISGGRSD
jgi:hypothetical protein